MGWIIGFTFLAPKLKVELSEFVTRKIIATKTITIAIMINVDTCPKFELPLLTPFFISM